MKVKADSDDSIIPKVSVCVITYNQEKYIRRCLESLLSQEADFPFEIIVGDDCSSDGTRDILQDYARQYPSLIKLVLNEKNVGYRKNYINVHSLARGRYVAHCDGDDYWYPGKMSLQAEYLDRNPEVSAVFSNAETARGIKYKPGDCGLLRFEKILERVYTNFLCVQSSVMERWHDVKAIYEQEGEVFDFEWHWLKHRNYLVYVDPVPRLHYELSQNGVSRQRNFVAQLEPSLERFRKRGLNAETLEKIYFDYEMAKYFSDPAHHQRPSIIKAIRFGYELGLIIRLSAPTSIYHAIKLIRHPELKPGME